MPKAPWLNPPVTTTQSLGGSQVIASALWNKLRRHHALLEVSERGGSLLLSPLNNPPLQPHP